MLSCNISVPLKISVKGWVLILLVSVPDHCFHKRGLILVMHSCRLQTWYTCTCNLNFKIITVMILSFRAVMPGQTVQTQISLLLEVEPHSSNLRVITTIFGVSEYLGNLRYSIFVVNSNVQIENNRGWILVFVPWGWPKKVSALKIWALDMTKSTKWHVRPAKTQISLGIRPVWSESSLSAWRKFGSLATHWARRLWSDWAHAQADMSLRWARTLFVGFVMSWLNFTALRAY